MYDSPASAPTPLMNDPSSEPEPSYRPSQLTNGTDLFPPLSMAERRATPPVSPYPPKKTTLGPFGCDKGSSTVDASAPGLSARRIEVPPSFPYASSKASAIARPSPVSSMTSAVLAERSWKANDASAGPWMSSDGARRT